MDPYKGPQRPKAEVERYFRRVEALKAAAEVFSGLGDIETIYAKDVVSFAKDFEYYLEEGK